MIQEYVGICFPRFKFKLSANETLHTLCCLSALNIYMPDEMKEMMFMTRPDVIRNKISSDCTHVDDIQGPTLKAYVSQALEDIVNAKSNKPS